MKVYNTWWIHIPDEIVEVEAENKNKAKAICYRLCRCAEFQCKYIEFRAKINKEGKPSQSINLKNAIKK